MEKRVREEVDKAVRECTVRPYSGEGAHPVRSQSAKNDPEPDSLRARPLVVR